MNNDTIDSHTVTITFRELVFRAIARERIKQEAYKAAGRFKHTCADDALSDTEKLCVLTEEHGEVAKEVCELFDKGECPERRARLKKELIQVVAVAVAWLEAIERQEVETFIHSNQYETTHLF